MNLEIELRPIIFLIGVTGFVGGSVFARLRETGKYRFLLLLRDKEKAEKLKSDDVVTIVGSFDDFDLIADAAHRADLTLEAASSDYLPEVKAIVEGLTRRHREGKNCKYVQTSGSRILDEDVRGMKASDFVYNDEDEETLNALPITQPHRDVDTFLIDSSMTGVFDLVLMCPPTIYGEGMGPKGISSIRSQQVPAMIKAALKKRKAQQVGKGLSVWSNVNIRDLTLLYNLIVEKLLAGSEIDINRKGYYFATTGVHTWNELAKSIAKNLFELGVVDSQEIQDNLDVASVKDAFDDEEAKGYLGSNSRSEGRKGKKLGWQLDPESQGFYEYVKWECERMAMEKKSEIIE